MRKVIGIVGVLGLVAGVFALGMAFVLKNDPYLRGAHESAERSAAATAARLGGGVDEGEIGAKTDARMAADFRQNVVIGLVPLLAGAALLVGLRTTRGRKAGTGSGGHS